MPAVNPRRESPCFTDPVASGRFQEEGLGWGQAIVSLALVAAILVPAHLFLWSWGWLARIIVLALDLAGIAVLALLVDERRAQSRFGLGYVRLDELSFTLGGPLVLHVGSGRGLGGLSRVSVELRCVDAVFEEREVASQQGHALERQRVCYVVWADERSTEGTDLPARGEARFEFLLPLEADFAGPVGEHDGRYWEVVATRYGGASALRFRVLVYPPAHAGDL